MTGKYRGSAHRYCSINVELNQKIPVVFRNVKNHDSDLLCRNKSNLILKQTSYQMDYKIHELLSSLTSNNLITTSK